MQKNAESIEDRRTALYRHFDAQGELLYVGIAANPVDRTAQHSAMADWFGEVARVQVQWFADRSAAHTAEREAIRNENPRANRVRYSAGEISLEDTLVWLVWCTTTGDSDGWYVRKRDALDVLVDLLVKFPDWQFELIGMPKASPKPRAGGLGWCLFDVPENQFLTER